MLPNSPTRTPFLSRVLAPLALFVLLLSLAGNIVLLLMRQPDSSQSGLQSGMTVSSSSSSLSPLAFGDIVRPIPMHPNLQSESGAALKPVSQYVLPASILPTIPEDLPVYRDQGLALDPTYFTSLFRVMNAPVDPVKMQLLPENYTFKSADGLLRISLSLPSRVLTISRILQPQRTVPPVKADDAEVMGLAKTFAATLNIDLTTLAPPSIIETKATSDQPKKTFVVWPLLIDSYPVFTSEGVPVYALSMQIGRVSHRAINVTMTLLSSDLLAASAYPTLTAPMLSLRLMSGGLLPLPRDPKAPSVTYGNAAIAYVLLPQNDQYPTYLVPAIRASFESDGRTFSTLFPLLDRKHFDWKEADTVQVK